MCASGGTDTLSCSEPALEKAGRAPSWTTNKRQMRLRSSPGSNRSDAAGLPACEVSSGAVMAVGASSMCTLASRLAKLSSCLPVCLLFLSERVSVLSVVLVVILLHAGDYEA